MKHIKSTLNIRTPKAKNSITNLFIYPSNIPEKKYYYYSPSFQTQTQLVSIPSSENIKRSQLSKLNLEAQKKNKNINIQFNIQNKIIQNNYNPQLSLDKKSYLSKLSTEKELIDNKDKQIDQLRKEVSNTKHQISLLLNEKNAKHLLNKIDASNNNLSERQSQLSVLNKQYMQNIFPSSSSTNANAKQFFQNSFLSFKTPSAKEKRSLHQFLSPQIYSIDLNNKDEKQQYNNAEYNAIINSMEDLHKRTSHVLNKYLNVCINSTNK